MKLSRLGFLVFVALAACRSTPAVDVDKRQVLTGEDVVVTLGQHDARAYDQYWVALQPADASESDVTGRVVLERQEYRVTLRASSPGAYEVRLHDRYPKLEHHLVARIPVKVDGYVVKTGEQVQSARP